MSTYVIWEKVNLYQRQLQCLSLNYYDVVFRVDIYPIYLSHSTRRHSYFLDVSILPTILIYEFSASHNWYAIHPERENNRNNLFFIFWLTQLQEQFWPLFTHPFVTDTRTMFCFIRGSVSICLRRFSLTSTASNLVFCRLTTKFKRTTLDFYGYYPTKHGNTGKVC